LWHVDAVMLNDILFVICYLIGVIVTKTEPFMFSMYTAAVKAYFVK